MTKLRLIRGSEVSSFLMDRKAWKYRWVDHLVKRQQDGKLFFGTLFHKHMEHWYGSLTTLEALNKTNAWLREQDTSAMDSVFYQEMIELFHSVIENYDKVYQNDLVEITRGYTELRFAIPLFDESEKSNCLEFAYEGTIDLIYVQNGKLMFMDHKTVSSIDRYANNAVLDRQISRYWWALTALCQGYGYVWEDERWVDVKHSKIGAALHLYPNGPSGFVYNLVKKTVPSPPRLLKGGALSKAKDQNTTARLYEEAIILHGLDRADYADIINTFTDDKFLKRVDVVRNWSECQAAMDDFSRAARDMLQQRSRIAEGDEDGIYWNITWDTPTFNAYYPLIQAEVMGENVSLVKAALYTTEEVQGDEYIEVGD